MNALKYVVVDEPLGEAEVHPPESYKQLVELSVSSAAELRERRDVDCPACGSPQRQLAFDKSGYTYWSCDSCTTLFVSPRPIGALLDWYLHESPAARFRNREDYRQPLKRRALEVASIQAEWVLELLEHGRQSHGPVVDLHTRFPEHFELLSQQGLDSLITVDPLCPLPDTLAASGSLRRLDDLTQLTDSECQILTAFNVLEHLEEPAAMAREAFRALAPGGLLALTTRSSSGLDIQVLWQQCPTIFPADHLNLLSVEGVRTMLEAVGFELLEISTPGQLDVEIVARVLDEHSELEAPGLPPSERASISGVTRFLRYLLRHRGADTRSGLQHFLQQHLLSSHLRVIARKPRAGDALPTRGVG